MNAKIAPPAGETPSGDSLSVQGLTAPRQERARYDPTRSRQSLRRGKERGVWVFLPAAELRKAGVDPQGPPPRYRTWGRRSGSMLVRLYDNPAD